ncbi:MAG: hypothetical protein ACOY3P_25290 [Planctomycetota bacterium]
MRAICTLAMLCFLCGYSAILLAQESAAGDEPGAAEAAAGAVAVEPRPDGSGRRSNDPITSRRRPVAAATATAKQLDERPAMVEIEVEIGELIDGDTAAEPEAEQPRRRGRGEAAADGGQRIAGEQPIRSLGKFRLVTLSNQSAFLQVGGRVPRVTGVGQSSRGVTRSVTIENIGTIVNVTPAVSRDGLVTMEFEIEDSRLGPTDEGAVIAELPEQEPLRTSPIETFQLKTTLQIKSGESVLVGGSVSGSSKPRHRLVKITAMVKD